MGIIIAAAAVLAIHIDKNHEIKINPSISLLGDDPIVLRVPRAIRLKYTYADIFKAQGPGPRTFCVVKFSEKWTYKNVSEIEI